MSGECSYSHRFLVALLLGGWSLFQIPAFSQAGSNCPAYAQAPSGTPGVMEGRWPVQVFHFRLSLDELCPIQAARFAAWVGKHDRPTSFNRTPSAIDFSAGSPSTAIRSRRFLLGRTRIPQWKAMKTTEGNDV